jgi:hypothetical protein
VFGLVYSEWRYGSFRWAVRDFLRYRDDRLGYLGERAVGDALPPLIEAGYRVFHELPAEVKKMTFNVDHVAVGLGGVFANETLFAHGVCPERAIATAVPAPLYYR